MDSEHRHELEENTLASWLSDKIDGLRPHFPAILLGFIAVIGGLLGWNAWSDSQQANRANRWQDFTVAVEGVRPNIGMLKEAAANHPDTPVEEWSRITWADGKLWEASRLFLRNRAASDEALAEAESAYEELQLAEQPEISQRAAYGLARVAEMRGELDTARERYGRVTGAFSQLAELRSEELTSERVQQDYAWLTATRAETATSSIDPAARPGAEPDDIALPAETATTPEDAEAAMADILEQMGEASESDPAPSEEDTKADSAPADQ